jgi:hypothetical protein
MPRFFLVIHWPSSRCRIQTATAGCRAEEIRLALPGLSAQRQAVGRCGVSWLWEPHDRAAYSSSCTMQDCSHPPFEQLRVHSPVACTVRRLQPPSSLVAEGELRLFQRCVFWFRAAAHRTKLPASRARDIREISRSRPDRNLLKNHRWPHFEVKAGDVEASPHRLRGLLRHPRKTRMWQAAHRFTFSTSS